MSSKTPYFAAALAVILLGCPSTPPPPPDPVDPVDPIILPNPTPSGPVAPVFQVTEEVYNATFQEIEALIQELNAIISQGRYGEWKNYLDQTAVDSMSNPAMLAELSEKPILKKFNIRMRTLNDYFTYVVQPSRSNAKLDEIVFLDNNHVTAYTVIKGEKTILYQLKRDSSRWKITIW